METLYQIRFPFKEINPLRMLVHDVDVNQFTIIGRVHSGKLATHDPVIICPGNWSTYVDEIKLNNEIVKDAYPSEIVSLKLRGLLDGVASRGALVSAPGFDQARENGEDNQEWKRVGNPCRKRSPSGRRPVQQIPLQYRPVKQAPLQRGRSEKRRKRGEVGINHLKIEQFLLKERVRNNKHNEIE
ncbi:hypothetical protein L1987_84300 [Smallanthus sonchifolius]|uniref:Uncharacterized protein n=1 Tax=Smallanthus sonchifolius TaxID=185202 RepID=A0ACB8YFI7_9ASTR|nr:hypothetical protein L1987_84300 [Smallanthus sonchifolius]